MSGNRGLFLRVGLLLVGSAALLVGAILALTGDNLASGKMYETYFRESVQGLDVGAPVKFRGVTLGRITNVGLVSAEYGATEAEQVMDATYRLIVVRFKIEPKRVGRLPETAQAVASGLRARLANQGLTGVMYLELDFLPPELHPVDKLPWQPKDDYIPSVPSTIAQVQTAVTDLLAKLDGVDLKRLVSDFDGLVGDVRTQVAPGGPVPATLESARATIADLREQLLRADLPALSAQLRRTGASVETLADGRQTHEVLQQASRALEHVPQLIATLQATVSHAGTSVGDVQSELMPILRDARVTLQNLRDTSEQLRRDPGQLLWQAPPKRDHAR